MGVYVIIFILALLSASVSFIATRILLHYLRKYQILDMPNLRSNHKLPTPRGGGIAVVLTIIIGFIAAGIHHGVVVWQYAPVFIGAATLAVISWIDDCKPIRNLWRFLVQIGAVVLGMVVLFNDILVFQGLFPVWLDSLLAGFIWLWFINLYNFMDGIDGITGCETLFICFGVGAITLIAGLPKEYMFIAALVGGSTLGFLFWNWHPARIFMGDVGSVVLGYLLGWLLLALAGQGYWLEALIIPAYYLMDSTFTILQRLVRGEVIWEAHSQHFYQKAVRAGESHSSVVLKIAFTNVLLFALATDITYRIISPITALMLALLMVALLLYILTPVENE